MSQNKNMKKALASFHKKDEGLICCVTYRFPLTNFIFKAVS